MASVATYLNFDGTCEEAFTFYRSVFGGEFIGGLQHMREVPMEPGAPPLSEEEGGRVMHVALETVAGHQLMGSDIMPSRGHVNVPGNNVIVNLMVDTQDEALDLFDALSAGGEVSMPLTPMFWGDLYSTFADRFGVHWMVVAPLEEELGHS